MADPGLALHKALLAALKTAVSVEVFDAVPEGQAYPYVTMDTDVANNRDFVDARMDERFVFLNVWSRQRGQEEVKRIIRDIQTINEQPLTLDEGTAVSVRVESSNTRRDADNVTFMGNVTLRVLTHH